MSKAGLLAQPSSSNQTSSASLSALETGLHWTVDTRLKMKSKEGFPSVSVVKNPPANTGDMGYISDPGRSHVLCSY